MNDYYNVLVFAKLKLIFNSKLSLCLHFPLHQLPKNYLYPKFYYCPSFTYHYINYQRISFTQSFIITQVLRGLYKVTWDKKVSGSIIPFSRCISWSTYQALIPKPSSCVKLTRSSFMGLNALHYSSTCKISEWKYNALCWDAPFFT